MKKTMLLVLTLLAAGASASISRLSPHPMMAEQASPPEDGALKNVQGVIKADGDRLKFVMDGDGTAWDVMNPDLLKGHVGEHVELNVHLYPSKKSIHVHTVKKL